MNTEQSKTTPSAATPAAAPTPPPAKTKEELAEVSRKNGARGGRPVSTATLLAQAGREYIATQLKDSLGPIVAKTITLAMEGNSEARNWLTDRAWGKAPINLGVDDEGKALTVVFDHAFASSPEGDSGE